MAKTIWFRIIWLLSLVATAAWFYLRPTASPEGLLVLSHDTTTKQWTFIRSMHVDNKLQKKRITAVCSFYGWGSRELSDGPDACDLLVGRFIQSRIFANVNHERGGHLYIFEDSDTLTVTEGDGDDRVMQQFRILENKMETTD